MNATLMHAPFVLKSSAGWSIALSSLMIVAGILGIILPPVAGIVATVFFGWLFIFDGLAHEMGWFDWLASSQRESIWKYMRGRRAQAGEASRAMMEVGWSSIAALAVAPMQDLLNLAKKRA